MSERKKIFACSYENCTLSFSRPDRLESHLRVHKNERPFICVYDGCFKSYTQMSHLKRHKETHEFQFRCIEKDCDMTFISRSTLKKHIDNVHLKKKQKSYKCSYCDEKFNKHNWLTQHEYKHTGLKPYVCPKEDCGKRFLHPSVLKKHLKIHEGYACTKPDCNQSFSKWTLLLKHIKVAHPTIYKCQICEKGFTTSYNLKAHTAIHDLDREVFPCPRPNCSRFYFIRRNLTHHIISYHIKRTFLCPEENCHKAFITEVDLNAHRSRHDLSKRLHKRKKKKNPKPPFSALLSGCVPKYTKPCKDKKETSAKLDVESTDTCKDEKQREAASTSNETVCNQECLKAEEKNEDEICITSDEDVVDEGIQVLLNMINERKTLNTEIAETKRKFVPFESCFAGCAKAI